MNYKRLIRVGGSGTPAPAPTSDNTETKPVVVEKVIEREVIDQETKNMLISIKDLLTQPENEPDWYENCSVTDSESADIVSFLTAVQKEYFPDIELAETINPIFMYNIPRSVVDVFEEMYKKGEPETLNPLFWFFPCCVNLDSSTFCKILKTALDNFTTGEYERIKYYVDDDDDDEVENVYEAPEINPEDIDITDEDVDMPPENIDESEDDSNERIDSTEDE